MNSRCDGCGAYLENPECCSRCRKETARKKKNGYREENEDHEMAV